LTLAALRSRIEKTTSSFGAAAFRSIAAAFSDVRRYVVSLIGLLDVRISADAELEIVALTAASVPLKAVSLALNPRDSANGRAASSR
jgi:hypothetical protein